MDMVRITGLFLLGCVAVSMVQAQTVYRSVDDQGRVTYSSEPVPGSRAASEVRIQPGPSEQDRQAALERQQRLLDRSAEGTERRDQAKTARGAKLQQAEQALEAARANLEQARIQREDDWQGRARGGHRLKESYFERVRQAEQAVDAAQQQLNRTKMGG